MANISKLKVQEILEHFITITKDFSILSYWKFVVLTTALACLILVNMVVTTTVGSKANSNVGKRWVQVFFTSVLTFWVTKYFL